MILGIPLQRTDPNPGTYLPHPLYVGHSHETVVVVVPVVSPSHLSKQDMCPEQSIQLLDVRKV